MQNISSRSSVMRRKQNFEIFESSNDIASLETQGQSVGSGEKVGRKFWSTGKRAHGYRLSPNYFQKFKRMPPPDWAQKMLCIIVPNRRTHLLSSFRAVRTRWRLSRHTCTVRSPSLCVQEKLLFSTFLTGNKGTTDESKKCFGCYPLDEFPPENILFLTDHNVL